MTFDPTSHTPNAAPSARVIKVATLNVRTGTAFDGRNSWPFRTSSLARCITDLDADIIGFQEVLGFQRCWLRRMLPGYSDVGVGRSRFRRGEASPVFVNDSFASIAKSGTRWFGATPDQPGTRLQGSTLPRIATTVSLVTGGGSMFDVTCVHLDHRSEARRRESTTQLLSWLDLSTPQIVLGDFNATLDSGSVRKMLDNGFVSALDGHRPGTFHGFGKLLPAKQIDHILVTDHFRVIRASAIERSDLRPLPSDHWPVLAEVELI
ncbi:MAG: endonuclease/exonuclease/phosphatase family protein [Microthrixaceae bacterium]|nr:endonuclease/exonuclease/phosphatase family protein [Microthrixaceae bacterium]